MTYCIPSDDALAEAIFVVMYRNQQVVSMREMTDLVLNELNKNGDTEYRVSGERIRRVAVNREKAKLVIDYNSSKGDIPETCPVCRNKMRTVRNATLDGGEIVVGRKCTACSFSVGSAKRVPGRYTFVRMKK